MAYIACGVVVTLLSLASIWVITPAVRILQLVLSVGKQASDGCFIYTLFYLKEAMMKWVPTSGSRQILKCNVLFVC